MPLKYLLIPLCIIVSFSVTATTPMNDSITINNQTYGLSINPLYQYLKDIDWQLPKQAVITSTNWRGYNTQWKIADNKLRLIDITINTPNKEKPNKVTSIYSTLFVGHNQHGENNGTVATWYSGALVIPRGQIKDRIFMGYPVKYQGYKVLTVKQGQVLTQQDLTAAKYQEYQQTQFERFKQTSFYTQELETLTAGQTSMTMKDAVKFMQSHYLSRYLAL